MIESQVAEIVRKRWCEVLETPQVAQDDDFFLSGGHSLLAVRLTAALREDLAVRIPVSVLFESKTLECYAGRVAGFVLAET
ncbi:phosphopantetheine-binding protein [Nonomuraea sp. NPDC050394]|uniref:phosphopantetheine-binding protein n=1 Tax=Nonomuraea sp. NPDC050394 TaxID=3364363 RepID=UPI0037B5A482